KLPSYAQAGVTEMLAQPLMTSIDDECSLSFLGLSKSDSWPNSGTTGVPSEFTRLKPSATLCYKLVELNDPRRHVWFAPVEIPIKVVPAGDANLGGGNDVTVGGVRYLNEDALPAGRVIYSPATHYADRKAGLRMIDTNSVYVGLPSASSSNDLYDYNLNPNAALGGDNVHVSSMDAIFNNGEGSLLKARLFSAAEVHFLMAEAALKGWGSDAETHYNNGVQASLEAWGIGSKYADYIDNVGVAFDGSMEMLMDQKWIASFTNATEAYHDWRRTGLPMLEVGPAAKEVVMPLRFQYAGYDVGLNPNYDAVLNSLEGTQYGDGNSVYAKNWLQQGVFTPW
ncbi:MAG: SusD/RagB family nutrient-binding outer membrane lipoprotein, partial [Spirochaetales bacterium]|nr:SusD/RagB family nutrient-binding outer membrane lipoprotein [Spirochaetales bacterium]